MRARRPLLPWLGAMLLAGSAAAQEGRTLDDFSNASGWRAEASDGVTASGTSFDGGLRLDYDFTRGSGYAFLRRELPLELPENFELSFRLRGGGAANALEIKLVDGSGDNVWWHRRPDYVPPGEWTTIRIKRRQIEFAWGPTEDKTLRRAAAIEFVVAAGSGGGKGWIAVDDLRLTPLPAPPAVPPAIVAEGSGRLAVDGDRSTSWSPAGDPVLDLDLGYQREFGGLVLRWADGRHASDYEVQFSGDGRDWRTVREVRGGDGGSDWLKLTESEARHVRLRFRPPAGRRIGLAEVEVRPLEFGASDNAFLSAVAKEAPRGAYPRGFNGEQNYWTLVATPEGGESGLMDESGAIEVRRRGFSVEPFVEAGGRLVSWADVEPRQALLDDYLPIPSVTWEQPSWSLTTQAEAVKVGEAKQLVGTYTLSNTGSAPVRLVLAVRPMQVNPPQQFLNITGGVSRIEQLAWEADGLHVNGERALVSLVEPEREVASPFDSGMLPAALGGADVKAVNDPTGLASGAMVFAEVPPGEQRTYRWMAPLGPEAFGRQPPPPVEAAATAWQEALGDVKLSGPPSAQPVLDTLKTALAHVLATREGPALRPGSRAYARAWIRDGAMMSSALLRMGLTEPAERFLEYYAPYQYPSGKVPCCVDARGADPVPEHDSDGELIYLVAELERYAPDAARLRRMWPRVLAAANHIEALRQKTRTAEFRAADKRHLFGLVPPSISHEGYSAKPAYSYWDDFWALAGLKDAAWIAGRLGAPEQAALRRRTEEFRGDILASIAATQRVHGIAFIPGAADLGDFDATSTTIALSVADEARSLPEAAVEATFERYWREFEARRDGRKAWEAYTPYEWRNVGAFVRLGWRDRNMELVDFFMDDRRPATWNQWAEVVGREPREPRFLGDMPHGWVASDFINAALDMIAYDQAGALNIAAGVPKAWLADGGITVERLRTPHGPLSLAFSAEGTKARLRYSLDGEPPPRGLVFAWPQEAGANARVNGRSVAWSPEGVALPGRSGVLEFTLR